MRIGMLQLSIKVKPASTFNSADNSVEMEVINTPENLLLPNDISEISLLFQTTQRELFTSRISSITFTMKHIKAVTKTAIGRSGLLRFVFSLRSASRVCRRQMSFTLIFNTLGMRLPAERQ